MTRKTRLLSKIPSVDGRVRFNESLFAIKLVDAPVALIWPRKHLRTRFEPEMVGPRSPSCGLPPNHDTETTVFPRPQRETRERYAPAIAAMIRPTDDDRHLPDRLRAVPRVATDRAECR
jgi:hypothetical protein